MKKKMIVVSVTILGIIISMFWIGKYFFQLPSNPLIFSPIPSPLILLLVTPPAQPPEIKPPDTLPPQ
jgi:hypothetical protein